MLGVSRPIYVAVDSPNLGFPCFNFLGGYQLKKIPCTNNHQGEMIQIKTREGMILIKQWIIILLRDRWDIINIGDGT